MTHPSACSLRVNVAHAVDFFSPKYFRICVTLQHGLQTFIRGSFMPVRVYEFCAYQVRSWIWIVAAIDTVEVDKATRRVVRRCDHDGCVKFVAHAVIPLCRIAESNSVV